MIRSNYFDNTDNIPEYYKGMYLDGFEPWQIMVAMRKKQLNNLQAQPQQEEYTVNVVSSVEVKR